MSEKGLKVTDKRMFTPEGELREEFRQLEEGAAKSAVAAAAPEPARPPESAPRAAAPPRPAQGPIVNDDEAEPANGPGFFDLVGLLAEPASAYLREAQAAGPGAAAQSLELARLHIELLAVLQKKTQGNLDLEEKAMLEDVVYRLRGGYVGLRG